MTTIAALQCVERGQIALDDAVPTVLHKLKDPEILAGFKEGTEEPTYLKAKGAITLRSASNVLPRREAWKLTRIQTSPSPLFRTGVPHHGSPIHEIARISRRRLRYERLVDRPPHQHSPSLRARNELGI
jgi:hypothetical protein